MNANWFNKLSTRASLLRSELLIIVALIFFLCLGITLKFMKGYEEKESLILRLEEEQFTGSESDSILALEHAKSLEIKFSEKRTTGSKLNFNLATEQELLALPDIGTTLANRLVRFRTYKGGKINRLEELLEVKGITPARFEGLKDFLEVK